MSLGVNKNNIAMLPQNTEILDHSLIINLLLNLPLTFVLDIQ